MAPQAVGLHSKLIYRYVYTEEPVTFKTIVHEWCHLSHPTLGEGYNEQLSNKRNAIAAGEAAYSAYKSDKGSPCK